MAPKKKQRARPAPFKTVNEAAHWFGDQHPNAKPQDEVRRGADKPNPFGYATKIKKAKGSPATHNAGLPPKPKPIKSTATKSKNRFKKNGYLA